MLDYRFLKNPLGQLSLMVALSDLFPDHPRIFYDGGKRALFCRTPSDVHVLENIPADIWNYLAFADSIKIHESGQAYTAQTVFVQDIPALRGNS